MTFPENCAGEGADQYMENVRHMVEACTSRSTELLPVGGRLVHGPLNVSSLRRPRRTVAGYPTSHTHTCLNHVTCLQQCYREIEAQCREACQRSLEPSQPVPKHPDIKHGACQPNGCLATSVEHPDLHGILVNTFVSLLMRE